MVFNWKNRGDSWCALPKGLVAASLIPFALPFLRPLCDVVSAWPGASATVAVGTILDVFAGCICLAAPIILLGLSLRSRREGAIAGAIVVVLYLAGYLAAGRVQEWYRRRWFEAWTQQPHPVIDAIHTWERDHGAPPESLRELVPRYLLELPDMSGSGAPQCWYFTARPEKISDGNRWRVIYRFPTNIINHDWVTYYPKAREATEPRDHLKARWGHWEWTYDSD